MRGERSLFYAFCLAFLLIPLAMYRTWQPTMAGLRRNVPFLRYGAQRNYASLADLHRYPTPGASVNGFTLQHLEHYPELELTALRFNHEKTGADYLHVARDDSNNVFSIGFKTNPPDATGVPHILEHTTLCGSQKYAYSNTPEVRQQLTLR